MMAFIFLGSWIVALAGSIAYIFAAFQQQDRRQKREQHEARIYNALAVDAWGNLTTTERRAHEMDQLEIQEVVGGDFLRITDELKAFVDHAENGEMTTIERLRQLEQDARAFRETAGVIVTKINKLLIAEEKGAPQA